MTKSKENRPILLGVFKRNDRENVIIDMERCERLGLRYGRSLALYLTPNGQVIGKVVNDRYEKRQVVESYGGETRTRMMEMPVYDWLSDWNPDGDRYMPKGFLAPEDDRW